VAGLAWFALAGPGRPGPDGEHDRIRARRLRCPHGLGPAIAALTLLTGFIAWIAARTTLLAVRGRLFPAS